MDYCPLFWNDLGDKVIEMEFVKLKSGYFTTKKIREITDKKEMEEAKQNEKDRLVAQKKRVEADKQKKRAEYNAGFTFAYPRWELEEEYYFDMKKQKIFNRDMLFKYGEDLKEEWWETDDKISGLSISEELIRGVEWEGKRLASLR